MEPEDVEPLPPPVRELLDEDDPFRLVIRAHAEVERLVAMTVESLFVDKAMPDELKHLGFKRTLSLATSLGLVPRDVQALITPLSKLRHEFAHGASEGLSPTRAKEVLRPCRPYLPEQIKQHLKHEPPITYVRLAAAVIYLQVADGVRIAVAEREFAERAVAEARKDRVLTLEQIEELLAMDEASE